MRRRRPHPLLMPFMREDAFLVVLVRVPSWRRAHWHVRLESQPASRIPLADALGALGEEREPPTQPRLTVG